MHTTAAACQDRHCGAFVVAGHSLVPKLALTKSRQSELGIRITFEGSNAPTCRQVGHPTTPHARSCRTYASCERRRSRAKDAILLPAPADCSIATWLPPTSVSHHEAASHSSQLMAPHRLANRVSAQAIVHPTAPQKRRRIRQIPEFVAEYSTADATNVHHSRHNRDIVLMASRRERTRILQQIFLPRSVCSPIEHKDWWLWEQRASPLLLASSTRCLWWHPTNRSAVASGTLLR
jgi:hypothetical protein